MLAAMFCATLTACAGSTAHKPALGVAADPVIRKDHVLVVQCPAELTLPAPAKVKIPAGAQVTWNDLGGQVYRDHLNREALLESRLTDAAKTCPAPSAAPPPDPG